LVAPAATLPEPGSFGRQAVLVLGMHRSGTSAVTRVISLLGADLPTDLMSATDDNPRGYWESNELMRIHNELLAGSGSRWDDWQPFVPSNQTDTIQSRLLNLLEREFASSRLFVVKDPRICRFVPTWLKVLNAFSSKPFAVIPVRHPFDVAHSLLTRDNIPFAKGCLLWLRHVLEAERSTRSIPRAMISYEQLLDNWQVAADRLTTQLRISWPRAFDEAAADIETFLSTELRHHATPPEELVLRSDVVGWIRRAYHAMGGLSNASEDEVHQRELDQVRAEFDNACLAFGDLVRAEREDSAREALATVTVVTSGVFNARMQGVEQRLSVFEQTLESSVQDLRQQQDSLSQSTVDWSARTDSELKSLADRQTELQRHVTESEGQIENLTEAVTQLHSETGKTKSGLTACSAEVADQKTQLATLGNLTKGLRVEVAQSIAATRRRFESISERDQRNDDRIDQLRQDVASADSRVDGLRDSQDELLKRIEGLQAQLEIQRHTSLRRRLQRILRRVRPIAKPVERALRTGRDLTIGLFTFRWLRMSRHDLRLPLYKKRLLATGLFDPQWYLEQNPDVAAAGVDPLEHWLKHGVSEGRNPNAFFDTQWYLQQYPHVAQSGQNPLVHYLRRGADNGSDPSPRFQTELYVQQHRELRDGHQNALAHFLQSLPAVPNGQPEPSPAVPVPAQPAAATKSLPAPPSHGSNRRKLAPRPSTVRQIAPPRKPVLTELLAFGASPDKRDTLAAAPQADEEPRLSLTDLKAHVERLENACAHQFAVQQNLTAVQANLLSRQAEVRVLKQRLAESKANRSDLSSCVLKLFDLTYGHQPVKRAKRRHDRNRRRRACLVSQVRATRLVDSDWYLSTYPDVNRAGMDAVEHYALFGVLEGRNPNPFFDTAWYLATYQDVTLAGVNPVVHYHKTGWQEKRNPSPRFNTSGYIAANPDVDFSKTNPLAHHLSNGEPLLQSNGGKAEDATPMAREDLSTLATVPIEASFGAREFEVREPLKCIAMYDGRNEFCGLSRYHAISAECLKKSEQDALPCLRLIPLSAGNFVEITCEPQPAGHVLRLSLELTSGRAGELSLQYMTTSDRTYDEQKKQVRSIQSGDNHVSFELGTSFLHGPQRLSLKSLSDPVWIKSISLEVGEKPSHDGPIMSFIVPCFNHGEFVTEAVESIMAVKERDLYEVIVVDDGSTDVGCSSVLGRLAESGVTVIRQRNQGLGAARNNGIKHSHGRYVLPVDADNTITPAYFHRSIEAFETDPEIGVVFSDVKFFGDQNNRSSLEPHEAGQQFIQNRIDACAAFRREVWEQVGGYQEEMIGYQDWEFWAAVDSLNFWKFYHMREVGFHYRVLPGSMVSHTKRFHEEIVDFISARHVRSLRRAYGELAKRQPSPEKERKTLGSPIVLSGDNGPLVSVIAPNFNKEQFLRLRLDSILKQTYRNIEVILLDDASTDNSRAILESYAARHKNVVLDVNDTNSGNVFAQWQKGIARANGEIIWIAECDDYCDTQFLSRLVPHLTSSFNIGVAYALSSFVDEKGRVFDNHLRILSGLDDRLWRQDFIMHGPDFVRRYMRRINCLPNASGVLFRRDLVKHISWDEVISYRVCGDWWIWSQLLSETNVYYCAMAMNYFRFNDQTVRSAFDHDLTRIFEHLRVLKMIHNRLHLSDEQRCDAVHCFKRGLQRHLDQRSADPRELSSLLEELYTLSGPLSVRMKPADSESDASRAVNTSLKPQPRTA
jgi:glycosyltransferase involved in cell wall biosynthesis